MKKTVLLITFLLSAALGLTGCKAEDTPSLPDIPPAPEASEKSDTSSQEDTESSSTDFWEEIYELQTFVSEEAREELYVEMQKTVEQYQKGQPPAGEDFKPLPQDFVFPDSWEKEDLEITRNEAMGDYRVVLLSADKKYSMSMLAENFIYKDADGNTSGGEMTVVAVGFIKN